MAYIINQSCVDFQQGGCLYKPTSSGIHWTPEHSWMSDRPHKQASAKADPSTFGSDVLVISLLIKLSIDNKTVLCNWHSVPKWQVAIVAKQVTYIV